SSTASSATHSATRRNRSSASWIILRQAQDEGALKSTPQPRPELVEGQWGRRQLKSFDRFRMRRISLSTALQIPLLPRRKKARRKPRLKSEGLERCSVRFPTKVPF